MKLKWALLSFFIVKVSISGDGSFLVCDKRCVNEKKKNKKNRLNSIAEVLRRLNVERKCYKQKRIYVT